MTEIADENERFGRGVEVFNVYSGEVMNYLGKSFRFSTNGVETYACGYDDYKRVLEWPYNETEKV